MESPVFCTQCGSKLQPGAKFCQGCGSHQTENVGAGSSAEGAPSNTRPSPPVAPECVPRAESATQTPGPETKMERTIRAISAAKFGLCILLFLMPFLNVSCSGMAMGRLSGMELSFGKTQEIREPFSGQLRKQKVNSEPLAFLALAVAIGGISICLGVKKRRVAIINAILGGLGLVFLLLLKSKLDGDVMREGSGLISINYEFAFWATTGLFIAISLLNSFSIFLPRILEESSPGMHVR